MLVLCTVYVWVVPVRRLGGNLLFLRVFSAMFAWAAEAQNH